MSKEKALGNFKISEAVKKPVSPSSASQMAKSSKKGDRPEAPSAGFPNIEGLIEGNTLDKSGLQARMDALEGLGQKGEQKAKAGARKALLAYQRIEELLDYLWSTKEKLQFGGGTAPADEKPKGSAGKAAAGKGGGGKGGAPQKGRK